MANNSGGYGDIRQNIVVALQAQGADAVGVLADAIRDVENKIGVLNTQFAEGSRTPLEYVDSLKSLTAALNRLKAEELTALQGGEAAFKARIDAIQAEERARVEAAERAKQAEGDALRARIDAMARAERAAMDAAEREKQAAGEAMRARIDAIARRERAEEAAIEATRVAEIKAMGERAQAHARAERVQEALEAEIRRATTAMEKEAVAAAWMARQARELDEALEGLAASERDAERAHVSAAGASAKAGAGVQAGAKEAGLSAYKWLLLGNAVQDATYGFEAIINNIPGIVMAFGGSGGLAGGIGIASVAAGLFVRKFDEIKKAFSEELPPAALNSVAALQAKLKELEAKEYKTRIDYTDLDITKKKLDTLMEAEASYERLKTGKSKAQQEAGRRATEALTEYGGGDDFDSSVEKVTHAVNQVTDPGVSAAEKELAQRIQDEEKSMDEEMDLEAKFAKADQLKRLKQEFETSFATARRNREAANARRIGRAGLGYGDDTKWLLDLLKASPEAFANHGVTEGLLPALSGAARPRVDRDLYEKRQGEIDKALDDRAKPEREARDAELERQIDENLATGPALGKQMRKAERDRDLEMEGEIEANLATGAEMKRQRLARQRDDRGDKREQTAHQKAVDKADDPYLAQLQGAIAQNRLGQVQRTPGAVPEATLARNLQAAVARNLKGAGQDPGLAEGIVTNAFEKSNEAYLKEFARTGNREEAILGVVQTLLANLAGQQQAGAQRDAWVARLQAQAAGLQRGQNLLRQHKPTLMPMNMGLQSIAAALVGAGLMAGQAQAADRAIAAVPVLQAQVRALAAGQQRQGQFNQRQRQHKPSRMTPTSGLR